ncbi:hypothetical protein N7541_010225 [Penicillium brevicompactum]|uniref:Uncharacterized protein n=1 Tax=Penicillium brevicompactum TaxID=5074 RepID=A0A9W9QN23_PENBR|nr:hypothetical protein N7452_004968 [Penicillium brevicompactum]KAJ5341101.1 hypothetical protein N7541_010225 [Penicillium brevicompactum]
MIELEIDCSFPIHTAPDRGPAKLFPDDLARHLTVSQYQTQHHYAKGLAMVLWLCQPATES